MKQLKSLFQLYYMNILCQQHYSNLWSKLSNYPEWIGNFIGISLRWQAEIFGRTVEQTLNFERVTTTGPRVKRIFFFVSRRPIYQNQLETSLDFASRAEILQQRRSFTACATARRTKWFSRESSGYTAKVD